MATVAIVAATVISVVGLILDGLTASALATASVGAIAGLGGYKLQQVMAG